MTRIIRRIIPENIEVEAHLPEEPIYVRINRAAFEQALVHLTTNARDALPSGGRITIDLTGLNEDEAAKILPEFPRRGPTPSFPAIRFFLFYTSLQFLYT